MIDKLIALCIVVGIAIISAVAPDPAPMAVSVPAAPVAAPMAPVEAPVTGCLFGECVTPTEPVTVLCPSDDAHNDGVACVWWGSVSGDGIGRSFWSDGDNDSPRVVFVDVLADGTYHESMAQCRTDTECFEMYGEVFGE